MCKGFLGRQSIASEAENGVDGCGWVGESCEHETEGNVKVENQEKLSRLDITRIN